MLGERPYMLESDLTHAAMRLAYAAHHGQLDKAGVPYVFHPYHLAEQMPDEITACVALLHDVLEDTSVTLEPTYPTTGMHLDWPASRPRNRPACKQNMTRPEPS